jgi:hypothetical protein
MNPRAATDRADQTMVLRALARWLDAASVDAMVFGGLP